MAATMPVDDWSNQSLDVDVPSPKKKKKRKKKKRNGGIHTGRLDQISAHLPHPTMHLGNDMDRSHVDEPVDTRTKAERTADLLTDYVSPPAHHWDDWAGPVLNDLRIFIGNVTSGMGDNPLGWEGIVRTQQQQILAGLGMIPFLVHMLESVCDLFNPDTITASDYPHLVLLVKGTFHLLKCLTRENNRNAFQLYKHHTFLSQMVGYSFGAVFCITEIFKGTPALLHSAELKIFVTTFWANAIESTDSRFITFLRDICFDEFDRPIDSNQEDVVEIIEAQMVDG